MQQQDSFLGVDRVMARTGLGRTFVYKLLRNGTIPSLKLGKRRLVRESELDRFMGSVENA